MSEATMSDPWLAVVVALFVLAFLGLALVIRREKRPAASTDAKLDALDRRLGAAEKSWSDTEHDVRGMRMVVNNLPTKESMNLIAVQVAESRGKMDGMQATLQSQTKSLDRIEDWLMKTSAEAIVGAKALKPNNGDEA